MVNHHHQVQSFRQPQVYEEQSFLPRERLPATTEHYKRHQQAAVGKSVVIRTINVRGRHISFLSGLLDVEGSLLLALYRAKKEATGIMGSSSFREWPELDKVFFFDRDPDRVLRLLEVLRRKEPITMDQYLELFDEADFWAVTLPGADELLNQLDDEGASSATTTESDDNDRQHHPAIQPSQGYAMNHQPMLVELPSPQYQAPTTTGYPIHHYHHPQQQQQQYQMRGAFANNASAYNNGYANRTRQQGMAMQPKPVMPPPPIEIAYAIGYVPPGQDDYARSVLAEVTQMLGPQYQLRQVEDKERAAIILHFASLGERPENSADQQRVIRSFYEVQYRSFSIYLHYYSVGQHH
jgi:hypothetical protein